MDLPAQFTKADILKRFYHFPRISHSHHHLSYLPNLYFSIITLLIYSPNIYNDGKVCISILHPPGDDPLSGETAAERWNPTQTVESILLSVISLLSDPNLSSPANVDAGVMYRNDYESFVKIVKDQVALSLVDKPQGLKIPVSEAEWISLTSKVPPVSPESLLEEDNFWEECSDSSLES